MTIDQNVQASVDADVHVEVEIGRRMREMVEARAQANAWVKAHQKELAELGFPQLTAVPPPDIEDLASAATPDTVWVDVRMPWDFPEESEMYKNMVAAMRWHHEQGWDVVDEDDEDEEEETSDERHGTSNHRGNGAGGTYGGAHGEAIPQARLASCVFQVIKAGWQRGGDRDSVHF